MLFRQCGTARALGGAARFCGAQHPPLRAARKRRDARHHPIFPRLQAVAGKRRLSRNRASRSPLSRQDPAPDPRRAFRLAAGLGGMSQMEPLPPLSFDAALGRRIIALYRWAVDQGLRGTPADRLFEGFCERLAAAGVPLTRAFAGMRTLHPQWAGYAYTWLRDRGAVEPAQIERGEAYEQDVSSGPFGLLIEQAQSRRGRRVAAPAPAARRPRGAVRFSGIGAARSGWPYRLLCPARQLREWRPGAWARDRLFVCDGPAGRVRR